MTANFYSAYLNETQRKQRLLYVMNPNKFRTCEFLIRWHEKRGDKVLVFSDNVFALRTYALTLKKPFIYGGTSDNERLDFLSHFQHDPSMNCLFISKVGDNSIDLPDVNVIIQISSHFSSRRQEAQRLGRILRPKARTSSRYNAYFYSLVSRDTKEMYYATKRQRFLSDQGYAFQVVTDIPAMSDVKDLSFSDEQSQHDLLIKVMAAEESAGETERRPGTGAGAGTARQRQKSRTASAASGGTARRPPSAGAASAASRRAGSMMALSGADDTTYAEIGTAAAAGTEMATAAAGKKLTKKQVEANRNALFRSRDTQIKKMKKEE